MSINTILLKSLPYISSIWAGIGVYYLSKYYLPDEQLFDLMTNVAASLLSIPLVFLFYEYSEYLVNRRVNQALSMAIIKKIDVIMLKILFQFRLSMCVRCKMSWQDIDDLLFKNFQIKSRTLKYTDEIAYNLKSYQEELESLVYRSDKIKVLSPQQIQILSFLLRDLSDLLGEYKLRKNKQELAHYTEDIMDLMGEWFATVGTNRLHLHNVFRLLLDKTEKK